MEKNEFEVIIIGGSYSGLSAAMTLGRAIRSTLIIDSKQPCNSQTPHAHNFITQDGFSPAQIAKAAKDQVAVYPTIQFMEDMVVSAIGEDFNFTVTTAKGLQISAKKLLFATGIEDQLPDIPGLSACWGISVIHCPYCHGYEYKDQPMGILSNDENTLDFSKLISNWNKDLRVFTNGAPKFSAAQQQEIKDLKVKLIEKPIASIEHVAGKLTGIRFSDGTIEEIDALYTRAPFIQHCPVPEEMGCEIDKRGYILTDDFKKTTIPGIYAAGDNISPMRSIANAVAAGSIAGARINHELITA
ncbi:NAD(P)/FAD-dependent oxidoreductase [Pedobacter cryoconitis]|uniref:Thioredoxin reductase n=1 Tax=Pedobacter cryoconitis TaxID=188932 RepID=A0A327T3P1_9SPHI|nr:NAD(P)/FAD-dependent oxidoreductase [Pedobacter cryoconitis]RAJ35788.1 thioredoxin reductase [Pedobacter cryoconitis]